MAVNLSPVGGVAAQFFTNTGAVLTGGKLYTYLAGTTTPTPTYTTSAGNVARTNPIVLDAAGRVPGSGEIWLTVGITYKFVLTDSNDVLIGTYDNVSNALNTDASLVSYTPAGTGAVTTTVQAKLRQYVSVKDFGAVGNGIADDTTAIQNAVNYVGSIGGTIFFPTGSYLVSSTIAISNSAIIIAGASVVGTFEGSKIVGNVTTPASIFSIANNVDHTLFVNIGIESAPIGIKVPIGALITDLSFNNVVFSHISDKAIYIADTSDGASGGLIVGNISNVQYNQCKSGFVSENNCMVNNVHFDNQWWYNPKDDGYGIYLGDSIYTTNNSIRDSLFNGKAGTTAIPFSFGKFNNITIDNVHTADFTQVNGVTDNKPMIQLRANIIPNSILKISNLFTSNPRGPIIDNLSTVGMGNLSIESCEFSAGFSNPIITNMDKIYSVSIVNSRMTAPTRAGNNSSMQYVNNVEGNSTTRPLNTFPTPVNTNVTMSSADVGSHYMFTTGASNLTVALPRIITVPLGVTVTVTKQDSGAGTVTLNRSTTDTVGGAGSFSYVLSGQYKSVTLISDGIDNWYVQT